MPMVRLDDGYSQTLFVGLICFSGPGMFNALTALGAAGHDDPHITDFANALLYISFGISAFFGGALFNLLGNRILFFLGGLSYVFYAVLLFLARLHPAVNTIAITSGAILGVGAAGLWTAQGTCVLAYAPVGDETKYISSFWFLFSLGGFVGGLVMCISNWTYFNIMSASPLSYLIVIGIMMVGPAVVLTVLKPTSRVVKTNGEPVVVGSPKPVGQELVAVLSGLFDTNMHLMALYFIMSNVGYAYFFNGINDSLFNIRTRGFNSALFWLVQMAGTKSALSLLDSDRYSKQVQGTTFFWILAVFVNAVFMLGAYVQFFFEGGLDDQNKIKLKIDVLDFHRSIIPIISLVVFGFADSLIQTFGMWMNSALAQGETEKLARYSGFSKSLQNLASAASWFADGRGTEYRVQLLAIWSLFVISLPTTFVAVKRLPYFVSSNLMSYDLDPIKEQAYLLP